MPLSMNLFCMRRRGPLNARERERERSVVCISSSTLQVRCCPRGDHVTVHWQFVLGSQSHVTVQCHHSMRGTFKKEVVPAVPACMLIGFGQVPAGATRDVRSLQVGHFSNESVHELGSDYCLQSQQNRKHFPLA